MQLFNTQSGRIERITPRDGKVGLYVCITPYDTTHIGHAFTFLTFDILVRVMRHKGWDVTYVQNVTDIDDDILRKAKRSASPGSSSAIAKRRATSRTCAT